MPPNLNAHARPPQILRDIYKTLQKTSPDNIENHPSVTTCNSPDLQAAGRSVDHAVGKRLLPSDLMQTCQKFLDIGSAELLPLVLDLPEEIKIVEPDDLPGLYIYPSLIPPSAQLHLLDKLVHRDLSNPKHQTNVHLHHSVPYPPSGSSYFAAASSDFKFTPKDPKIHKPFATDQFMNKKLRWVTLGGQYDWTRKVYPSGKPPDFPADVRDFIEQTFPMKAQAAIVNFYTPGDQLSLHRDVSEECSEPLVSISLGCDAVFLCGIETEVTEEQDCKWIAIYLRSGDAVLMSGPARYAWHGVPKVLENSCPDWMADWPCAPRGNEDEEVDAEFERWRGWMQRKRVNLNVRQMFPNA